MRDQIKDYISALMMWLRSIGHWMVVGVRSTSGARSWLAMSHFFEARRRAEQFGTPALGSSLP
ncbi:hypothetical protein DM860_001109 [Cuscuta australis]|uniref:Uncharacterized protein n=1 Tax=Cuscuta australis TaxID=267555 RepID=A0A328DWN9_9ASTE|nr:hypothetical protein DM860_001109 [Cuscuta australis]